MSRSRWAAFHFVELPPGGLSALPQSFLKDVKLCDWGRETWNFSETKCSNGLKVSSWLDLWNDLQDSRWLDEEEEEEAEVKIKKAKGI